MRRVLDRVAVERGDDRDDDLSRADALEIRELRRDRRFSPGVENARVVVDPRRGLGGDFVRRSRRSEDRRGDAEGQRDQKAMRQNFTCGGFSAPGSAWKNGLAVNPIRRATSVAGKMRIAVLYSWTVALKRMRSCAIRFSVPSSCD